MKTIRTFLAGALMWLAWAGGAAEAAPLFVENFNAGPGGFSVETPTAYDGPWVYNAGTGSWREDGEASEDDHANTSKLLSPVVTVPSAGFVTVTFTHRYSFEFGGTRFDGGQLLVSVNGGAFTTVPDAAFGENGYGGQTVAANSGSVLAGQSAFTAESPGYATSFIVSRASLGNFNPGDVVQVEFLAGSDSNTRGTVPNWEIDSVVLETPQDVTQPGDPVVATSDNSQGNEGAANAIDDQPTKYLNFDKLNAGFTVTPSVGRTLVRGLTLTSANDAPERDPASYTLEGSDDGTNFTTIASGAVPPFPSRFFTQAILFPNTVTYLHYRLKFPTVTDPLTANSMQIDEVEFLGVVGAVVTTTADGGPGSLRQVIADANAAGGTQAVSFDAGLSGKTITLTSGELVVNCALSVDASALPDAVTISGGNATRLFSVNAGQTLTLRTLTLTGGNGVGAASSGDGGAIYNAGTLTLNDCTLSNNNAGNGGAINNSGMLTINRSTLSNNTGVFGGGISNGGVVIVNNSTFNGNSTTNFGGAIFNDNEVALNACTFTDNQATLGGGAMSDNNGNETFHINHCTIAGNRSLTAGSGGGIDSFGATSITLTHTILAGNTANGTLRNYGTSGTPPDLVSAGYNLSDDAPAGLTGPGDQINSARINLGALTSNGGPTKTMLPLSTSAAVDAGDPDFADDEAQDQRGFHRLQGARIDIGAVESGLAVTVTTLADEDDGMLGGGTGISLREAIRYMPAGSTIKFDPSFSGKTIVLTHPAGGLNPTRNLAVDASDLPGGLTISGHHTSRIFYLSFVSLRLRGLTLVDGNAGGSVSPGAGGAIFNAVSFTPPTLLMFDCTLSGNAGNGGAILSNGGRVNLTRCTVTGNFAPTFDGGGGGLEILGGAARLTHCTVAGNTCSSVSDFGGGGIFIEHGATLELVNSIVAGNIDGTGTAADIANFVSDPGTVIGTGNNLIGRNTMVESVFPEGPLAGTAAAPLDPRLGPLGSYGGPTPTLALRPGSPAVDAASDSAATDQRGIAIVDTPDLGAYELRAITVNTDADELDVPAGANVSLREAVRDTFPGAAITFDSSVNSIVLDPAKGELAVSQDATIDGGSNGLVFIDGNDQVLHVLHVTAGHTVNLLGLVITGGHATGNFPDGYGGGIFNEGKLSLTECAVDTNTADVAGGGIYNGGANASLTLLRSLIVGNSAGFGGGVQNEAPMVSMASTFFNNRAAVEGGAISAPTDGSLQLIHTTIAGNSAEMRGGGLRGTNVTLANSIVTDNTAPSETNVSGTSILVGQNLVDVPAHFDSFGRHGGPTLTLSLAPDSPALDAAIGSTAVTDQRGFPIVGTPDIGAFEMQIGPIPDITTNEDTLSPVVNFTVGVVSTLDRLFPDGSAVLDQSITLGGSGSARTVRFTPVPNGNGTATITVGDTLNGDTRSFHVTVNAVNDAPAFTRGPDLTVFENSGPDSIEGWASNISAGPPDESGQALTFHVSNDNNALFTDQPAVDANGQISFTPAPGKHGVATVTLYLSDDGGRANGGVDRSAVQTFTIAVRLMAPESIVQFAKGDAAPGHGVTPGLPADAVLASFNAPAIDEAGNIAFLGQWTSGPKTKGTGLFVNHNTCLAIVSGGAAGLTGVGGAKFRTLSDPVISQGRVAFLATFSGVPAASASAVLSDVGGSLAIVARAGSSATVDGANFKAFKQVSIVGDAVAFLAQLAPGTGTAPRTTTASDLGLWLKDGATPLVLALREGQSVPGFTAKIKSFTSFAVGNGSPGQGRGWLQSGPVLVPDDGVLARVVFTDRKQAILRVTASTAAAPAVLSQTQLASTAGSPEPAGATFASYSFPSVNSQLASTFLGTLTPNPMLDISKANARGIFQFTDSGSYVALARAGDDSGVSGHAKFSVLKDPVLADDGDLAFAATLKGGTAKGLAATTLWRQEPAGSLALFAQAGAMNGGVSTDLPAGAQWKSFPSLAIAANRGPLFTGTLVAGPGGVKATDASGLWATDYRGTIRTLFRTGDMIGGKTLKSFSVLKASVGSTGVTRNFNGAQKVVWLATFKEDKSQAIVTTEVP